jgi:hypothetical protein
MQNPPQTTRHGKEPNGLEDARALILAGDYEHAALMYEDIPVFYRS